ncbi:reverse transcriptase domain-containing protein [Tanacetum coccineum]|uniref:Reverse transcriptase domain-containing protein n=1 Tax=Tanacetum coccineum TaxID=301880 RepID=A0ABQ5HV55_9ASTR
MGIVKNVLIKVDKFVLPIDFVILDMPEDSRILIILGRPFLAIARVMIDVFSKKITLRVGDDEVIFDMDLENFINQSELKSCNSIGDEFDNDSNVDSSIRHIDPVNTPDSKEQETKGTDRVKNKHLYLASANEIDEKKPELAKISEDEKISLLQVLEKRKQEEDLVVDHLSRLECPHIEVLTDREVADEFPDKRLMLLKSKFNDDEPWGPFPQSRGNKYILVAVDYVSKWVEAQALPRNDACVVVKFLRSLFARFGVPKALISDKGTHFCNSQLEKALQKYGVTIKLSAAYHPQSNGQTEATNRAIKRILKRSVGYNLKDWSKKLNDALWAFRNAYKTPTWCTPFKLVYGKACHLPMEIEHKAHWALKQCNMDLMLASKSRLMQLNEIAELRDGAYENTRIYKERTKKWHDSRLRGDKDFNVGDKVLLYNYRLKNGLNFKVNGQRLKKYYEGNIDEEDDEVIEFENGVILSIRRYTEKAVSKNSNLTTTILLAIQNTQRKEIINRISCGVCKAVNVLLPEDPLVVEWKEAGGSGQLWGIRTTSRAIVSKDKIESLKSSTHHSSVNEFVIINIPEEDVKTKEIILDPDDQPMWESAKTVASTPNPVIVRPTADPHDHIRELLAICDMFKYGETKSEAVKLLIFPFSLCDKAKIWFNELNEESITSWEQMRRAFIKRFFPPSLFNRLLLEIRNFSQNVCESLTEAWLRLKNMLRNCHGHGLTKGAIIQIFYHGLDEPTQGILDGTAGGIFLYKSPNQAFQYLEDNV